MEKLELNDDDDHNHYVETKMKIVNLVDIYKNSFNSIRFFRIYSNSILFKQITFMLFRFETRLPSWLYYIT